MRERKKIMENKKITNAEAQALKITEAEFENLITYVMMHHENVSKPFQKFFRGEYGWGSQQLSLICYLCRKDMITMSELADDIEISRQQMTRLVAWAVDNGLAERHYNENNRRSIYVTGTAKAHEMLHDGEIKFFTELKGKLKPLSDDERLEILESARKLSDYISYVSE